MRSAVFAVVVALAACGSSGDGKTVRIAAASDLTKAFGELGKEWKAKTSIDARFTFAASGLLAKEILDGKPYFMFAAANKDFIAQVVQAGKCDGATVRTYGRGYVVVWTRADTQAPVTLADLGDARFARIAIADPAHAPYGAAGKQALEKAGVWGAIEPKLVLGEDVEGAMRIVREGNADAAIVARSLAVVSDGGSYLAIDPTLYVPLEQQLVICGAGHEADTARQFADFIASREGREVMARYGFALPE